jgi:surfeit locus 1 family protein
VEATAAARARRVYVFAGIALLLAVLFVRLGFWQIRRLGERRALNAAIAARLASAPAPVEELGDSSVVFRRAIVAGSPDYDAEIVFTGRSRNGSPGVYLLTPVRVPGMSAAVLVNRGWVYAPDAATVQQPAWRESRMTFVGYLDTLRAGGTAADSAQLRRGRRVRTLAAKTIRSVMPYAVADHFLVVTENGSDRTPARLPLPQLNDGPHVSYAIQWFAFATIAVVGAMVVTLRARRDSETEARRLL